MTKRDWRLQTTANLKEDWKNPWTGKLVEKGARLTVVSVAKLTKKKTLTIPLPNASAILLSSSSRSYERARKIRKNSNIDTSIKKEVEFKTESDAFDYVEAIIESILLAHSAIEAFANEMIPEGYEHVSHKKSKIIVEVTNKSSIERYISLSVKLDVILPDVMGIESPKGKSPYWSDYKALKIIRDRITHMKTIDRKSSQPENDTVWHSLLRQQAPHQRALSIIRYFTSRMDAKPQWLERCPLK